MLRLRCLLALSLLALAACGDDENVSSECAGYRDAVCARACACGGSECKVFYPSGSGQTFTSSECDKAFADFCAEQGDALDTAQCEQDLEAAQCTANNQIELPVSCFP